MKWIAYAAAWIATAAAVIAGVYFTGSPWCLWVLLFPAAIGLGRCETNENNQKKNED